MEMRDSKGTPGAAASQGNKRDLLRRPSSYGENEYLFLSLSLGVVVSA